MSVTTRHTSRGGGLYKLYNNNCPNYLIRIVIEFLTNRKMKVKISNQKSEEFTQTQGVPQGSPLSPLLYNIFCHDIYNHNNAQHYFDNKSYILQFADDTAIISHGKTLSSTIEQLQTRLNATTAWMNKWRISINPQKSSFIIFNHKINNHSPRVKIMNLFNVGLFPLPRPITDARDKLISAYI